MDVVTIVTITLGFLSAWFVHVCAALCIVAGATARPSGRAAVGEVG
ncbi:hypothetical protein LRS74_06290 [Streptomyces sp. LX-29]|nr:hypothetical protein [Streptomyces sp. LX-29]WFB06695.1 hypothetical protein LRS74_06290 [Streptomyces sp. LX-29]